MPSFWSLELLAQASSLATRQQGVLDLTTSEIQDRRLNCLQCNNHTAFSVF